jgi:hypothetical protein
MLGHSVVEGRSTRVPEETEVTFIVNPLLK